jgi:hypothetical protein
MTDRASIIIGTQAAKAFPLLAKFLAENSDMAPDAAELAIRAACQDYTAAEEAIDVKASWSRALRQAQGLSSDSPASQAPAAPTDPIRAGWAKAMARANGGLDV